MISEKPDKKSLKNEIIDELSNMITTYKPLLNIVKDSMKEKALKHIQSIKDTEEFKSGVKVGGEIDRLSERLFRGCDNNEKLMITIIGAVYGALIAERKPEKPKNEEDDDETEEDK